MSYLCNNITNKEGHLAFAGYDVTELAKEYGTPLYLLDEEKIRDKCRMFIGAFRREYGNKGRVLYASKANSFKYMYKIMSQEGMGIDVVSPGEIYTAYMSGFDMSLAYFHSNNKTDEDIRFAMDHNVGYFVIDNEEEIVAIEEEAAKRGIKQKVLLRITPGIDPHTYEKVDTGKVDSKFGSAIETGQAEDIVRTALKHPHLLLEGIHCHVGSMVFEEDVFERTAQVMLEFMADMKKKLGIEMHELDLGGGYGIRYVESDPVSDTERKIAEVARVIKEKCAELGIEMPIILTEPGRAIVADAGMTVYTVGSVKKIPGFKNYVSVDGGMTDNPRYALYDSKYTCYAANIMNAPCNMKCSVVGRCCESGDIIQPDVMLPEEIKRGDLVAVCTTGAYNYSMSSHYNRVMKPPILMLREKDVYIAVRREVPEDLINCDC